MSVYYLLRFDDLCPTMNWEIWDQIESILIEHDVNPILAVVPDNKDKVLQVAPANPQFWDRVRHWQKLGWSIGMHGYQHLYTTKCSGLLGFNKFSEFAGVSAEDQDLKIKKGLEIFKREGVNAKTWIAPGNSFDKTTLIALKKNGFQTISDGFFLYPHFDSNGIIWVPHQIWDFDPHQTGVWTIGFHHNSWSKENLLKFRKNIQDFKQVITSFDEIISLYGDRPDNFSDTLFHRIYLTRLRARRLKNFILKSLKIGRG